MRKIHIIFCFLIVNFIGNAQSLSSFVTSSAGGYFSNSGGQLSFTAGETGLVSTFNQSNNMLTQGFQQPEVNFIAAFLNNQKNETFSWTIFPNPGNGQCQLFIKVPEAATIDLSIYNLIGELVLKNKNIDLAGGFQTVPVSISEFNEGMYLVSLTVYSSNNHSINTFSKYIQLIK